MATKTTFAQTNFTAGEISPRAFGRFDLSKFANGTKRLENFLIYQLGGAMYRSGSRYVAPVKDSTKKVRLITFQYSTIQAYVIEMGDFYMRFFSNSGQVTLTLSDVSAWGTGTGYVVGDYVKQSSIIYYCIVAHTSGTFATDLAAGKWVQQSVLEIPTPYAQADIFNVQFTQKADTMYLVHNSYKPQKLQRTSATKFTISAVSFVRGPFLDTNITSTTLTASAATGTGITVTASASTFKTTHVGSFWRIKSAVVKITAFSSATSVTADVQAEPDGTAGDIGSTSAQKDWAEGAFSAERGYPAAVAFHEQRLYYANTTNNPQNFWGSFTAAFDNFKTDANDDSASVTFQIVADDVNAILWLSSLSKALQCGTSGGTFSASSGTVGSPITSKNINVTQDTNYGVDDIKPKKISSYLYYLQKNTFQARELVYNYVVDRQISNDMTLLSDHIIRDGGGAVDMDHQQSPNDRMWVVRADGQMAILTRNPEQEVIGWSRVISGSSANGPGTYETVAILDRDALDDQVWVVCKRKINGSNVKWVEYFLDEDFDSYFDPVRLDASLSFDTPVTITNITAASPIVVTAVAHGFSNGDQVKIDNVKAIKSGDVIDHEINTQIFLVANKTTDTFQLHDTLGNVVDGTADSVYLSGGEVRKMVTTLSGLDHLNGETVTVQVDGGIPAAQQTYLVSGGAITLKVKAAVAHVGLPYKGTIQLLKLADGSPVTGETKTRRIYLSTMRVYRSLGIKIGIDENNLRPVYFGRPNDPLGNAPALVTGDVDKFFNSGWSKEEEIVIRQDQPLPLFILAVILRSEVEEK